MAPASQTRAPSLRLTRVIAAPRENVFRAWTTAAELKRWAAPGEMTTPVAEVDLQVGGRYRIHMQAPDGTVHQVTGVYQAVEPPRRLVYTWAWETGPEKGESVITVEFLERGAGQTEVVLTHERFPNTGIRDRHLRGWIGSLDKFAALF